MRFSDFAPALQALRRPGPAADMDAVQRAFAPYGGPPADYLLVLAELGPCALQGVDEPANYPAHLLVLPKPISAIQTYYQDDQVLRQGAKGDVLILATDSIGCGFGYDTGDGMAHVTCDNYRIVDPMPMTFAEWCFGTIACWPETPVSCTNGVWRDDAGRAYTQARPQIVTLP